MTEPMKTLEQLLQDWGNSTCGKEPERYIYDYMKNQVAAERERIKKVLRFRITFWNSATQEKEPKYSYKSIFGLIDSL